MFSQTDLHCMIDGALDEDCVHNDVTTRVLIPPGLKKRACLLIKQEGTIAGLEVAAAVFHRVDPSLKVNLLTTDGSKVRPGDKVATIEGPAAGILEAERVALNFLQRLSGIAGETAKYVAAISGTKARIVDTRKTTPGLRTLEKYAVTAGGGHNHRRNLSDGVLIKDNHLAALRSSGVAIGEAVKQARLHAPHTLKIEVEVNSIDQAKEALEAGADIILLDNMKLEDMRRAVELVKGRAILEASGGVTLENVRAVAETGVDFISIGALTHSARVLDISLEIEEPSPPLV